MIRLTHLNRSSFVLNCDLIEQIESTADTVITLTNSHTMTVLETADEIVERIRLYRRSVLSFQLIAPCGQEVIRSAPEPVYDGR